MALTYIGLGSNLNDPVVQVRRAMRMIAELPHSELLAQSRLYSSPPLGPVDQPDYINAVVALRTKLAPHELLAALQGIEQKMGRVRTRAWGERIIDLDILLYEDCQHRVDGLDLPHPGIAERAFVLRPLAELVLEGFVIPGQGTLRDLLAARAADVCFPLDEGVS